MKISNDMNWLQLLDSQGSKVHVLVCACISHHIRQM